MRMKLIAIGNRMMGDDGIAIVVAELMAAELKRQGIELIIGETDTAYCLSCIGSGGTVVILDAAMTGKEVGQVWSVPIEQAIKDYSQPNHQHGAHLLVELSTYKPFVKGLLLCIEVRDIDFRCGLSECMQARLPYICQEVGRILIEFRGEKKHA